MSVELQPFTVPNFVRQVHPAGRRQDGFTESLGIPLHALSPEELAGLCDEFRAAVFAKAMKKDPGASHAD